MFKILSKSILSNSSISSFMSSRSRFYGFHSQSWVHIRTCTNLEVKELLYTSNTRPPMLKADSEVTVDVGITNTSRAS